jgi:NADPH:quinone reductase-like Zn-dependent oxidoreductase
MRKPAVARRRAMMGGTPRPDPGPVAERGTAMPEQVPTRSLELRSLVTADGTVELALEEVDVPAPGPGEVLVRVEAAPINPSDLGLLLAGAGADAGAASTGGTAERPTVTLPLPPAAVRSAMARVGQALPVGNEGAGTVVVAGAGDDAQALVGRVVAIAGGAMYTQYRCVRAGDCLPLPPGSDAADGASSFVNPMTALGMLETMRAEGHTALVHTAAASNLGRMLNRICLDDDVPLVHVVRSPEQSRLLRDEGATFVCDSGADTFGDDLQATLRSTSATLAFDAVGGGALAGLILSAMEAAAAAGAPFSRYGSSVHKQVYIYGGLDRGPTVLARSWGMAWGVGGWLLPTFLQRAGDEVVTRMRRRVALRPEALAAYARQATGQKHLLRPHA